ncbi:MAG: DsbC family protein [Stagnimonas sp.]|nr:DsbC family protein [Stagnimonas sp.]
MNLIRFCSLCLLSVSLAATTASCAPPQPDKAKQKSKTAQAAATTATVATPAAAPAGAALDADQLKEKLHALMPDLALDAVRPSAIPGLFEVQRGALFGYVTADGRFLISGDLINLETGEELTEASRKQMRLDMLAGLGDQYVAFDPPGGKAQNIVTVFVDVDCGYCRKLHDELPSYNALGIGFHYVFFPRAGLGSDSERQLDAAWCSPDRKSATTRAIHGEKFTAKTCDTPTKQHYELAAKLGVRGTPMMILPTGDIVNGYVPAAQLAERIVSATLPPTPPGGGAAPKSAP